MVDEGKYAATLEEEMRAARIANVELTADERGAIERLLDGGPCVDVDALLQDMGEAAYKLGDMYSRGKFVDRYMAKAYQLWSRSLDLAEDIVEIAQPAIRIARLLLSEDCESAGVKCEPMRALQLFQQAEIGLRIDIDNGQTYYRKRLEEAIEGQERARAIIDVQDIDGPIF